MEPPASPSRAVLLSGPAGPGGHRVYYFALQQFAATHQSALDAQIRAACPLRRRWYLAYCIPVMRSSRDRAPRDPAAHGAVEAQGAAASESRASESGHPALQRIEAGLSFKHKAYAALKNAIVSMD